MHPSAVIRNVSVLSPPNRAVALLRASLAFRMSSRSRGEVSSTSTIPCRYADTLLDSCVRCSSLVPCGSKRSSALPLRTMVSHSLALSMAAIRVCERSFPGNRFSIHLERIPSRFDEIFMASASARTMPFHSSHSSSRRGFSSSLYSPWSRRTSCGGGPGPGRPSPPPARTRMFPGCGSQCTKPDLKMSCANTQERSLATSLGATPWRSMPSTSSMLHPRSKLIVSTLGVDSSRRISGTTTEPPNPSRIARQRSAFSASARKSSSFGMLAFISSTSHWNPNSGWNARTSFSRLSTMRTSVRAICFRWSCWTLTATSVPSRRTARWTCASEADAIGTVSNSRKSSDTGPPSSSRRTPSTSGQSLAGASSKHPRIVSTYSVGIR
mmetsp:Transcript_12454/g.30668  ORF Transcript_12454/g.30668 Transcript_12454/m.30668 type:complete len:382 (-) Transcript_12454:355-1500(-)